MSLFKKNKDEENSSPVVDTGIVIVSKEKAMWMKVKESREAAIKQYEEVLIIEKEIFKLACDKIAEIEKKERAK